jgi:hypothetical protein
VDDVVEVVARRARNVEWISWVRSRSELLAMDATDPTLDRILRRFVQSTHPTRSPDVVINLAPGAFLSGYKAGTTHGSPYDCDTHVPVVFFGAAVADAATVSRFVRTVDVAPTLAAALGMSAPHAVDGVVLVEALRDSPLAEPR